MSQIDLISNDSVLRYIPKKNESYVDRSEGLKQVVEICKAKNITKVLIDIRTIPQEIPLREEYRFLRNLRRKLNNFKLAIVLSKESMNLIIISELSKQYGDIDVRVFHSFDMAIIWLET